MLQAESTIQSAKTLVDGTVRLTVDLDKELSPKEMTELFKLARKSGWFLFGKAEFKEEDLPNMPVTKKTTGKSPSQRLRAVFYKLWEQTDQQQDFESFYLNHLERLIEHYKQKIL